MKSESDALVEAYRREGVHVIRNETGHTPQSLINYHTGWSGEPSMTLYGQSADYMDLHRGAQQDDL
jgi:hypothetical protein